MPLPNHTFPQSADDDHAEYFAQLIGQKLLSDYVEYGLSFSPDYANLELDVSEGVCYIHTSTGTTSDGVELSGQSFVVQLPGDTLQLDAGSITHIYVDPQLSTNDSPKITAVSNTLDAPDPGLKIGQVNTNFDTATESNREHPLLRVAGDGIEIADGHTISVDASDIAGEHLSGDGNDNLAVDDDFVETSGDTMTGDLAVPGLTVDGSRVLTTADEGDGNGLDAGTVQGLDPVRDIFEQGNSGLVASGNANILYATELDDGESIELEVASLASSDMSTAPSACKLVLIVNGSYTETVVSGGTRQLDVDPGTTHTNNSGGTQTISVYLDNGHFTSGSGADRDLYGHISGHINR
ncbi:hypothetical protein [Halosegnis longus]|uniref:hypothetical protein n=1 Tax=Halosegnis longus TaxID=2216012 RepID=UPI00129E0CB1|nr:hypothetical protein [Halosegnis longus]